MVMEYGTCPHWLVKTQLSSACQTAAGKGYSSWFLKQPIKTETKTEASSSSWLTTPDAPLSLV